MNKNVERIQDEISFVSKEWNYDTFGKMDRTEASCHPDSVIICVFYHNEGVRRKERSLHVTVLERPLKKSTVHVEESSIF